MAWTDPAVNAATSNFFRDTLPTLDHAYLRPRYDGFLAFQRAGGEIVHGYLRTGGDPRDTLDRLDIAYARSRKGE